MAHPNIKRLLKIVIKRILLLLCCVGVAKLLLDYGANINTHSNEFKESALTLACYKGHLEMVQFLLNAGM